MPLIQNSLPLFQGVETEDEEADISPLEAEEEARDHSTLHSSCNMAGSSVDCAKPQGALSEFLPAIISATVTVGLRKMLRT